MPLQNAVRPGRETFWILLSRYDTSILVNKHPTRHFICMAGMKFSILSVVRPRVLGVQLERLQVQWKRLVHFLKTAVTEPLLVVCVFIFRVLEQTPIDTDRLL